MKATHIFLIMAIVFFDAGWPFTVKASIDSKVENLNKNIENSQKKTGLVEQTIYDDIDELRAKLSSKLKRAKKDLEKYENFNTDLAARRSSVADIENKRKKLKEKVSEWTSDIRYTEVGEIKKGIEDALAVAEADGLNIDALTRLYNLTKGFIRDTQFRITETKVSDRLKNLDLHSAEIDERLRQLAEKHKSLKLQIESLTSSQADTVSTSLSKGWKVANLTMDLAAVEFEILQHWLNVDHEDISMPLAIFMDGLLSGLVTLGSLTERGREDLKSWGMEGYKFDRDAPIQMAEKYASKLVTLSFWGEELAADARLARQKRRLDFYKRSAVAYISALISGKDHAGECHVQDRTPVVVEYKGEKIKTLGCPDPVVAKLRAYLNIFKSWQSAEADRLISEGEKLVAEQQIIADFMAAIPLVGDALDVYSVYSGENLAGVKLSPLERGLIGVIVAIPLVGPHALKQVADRWTWLDTKIKGIEKFLESVTEFGLHTTSDLGAAKDEIGEFMLKKFAELSDTHPQSLGRVYDLIKSTPYKLDDAARARMRLFKTMRDAAEDRIAVNSLKNSEEFSSIFRRAKAESDRILDTNLRSYYGSWTERAAASNIPVPQLREFESLAKNRRQVYVFRPVGPDAADKIAKNLAGTKPLHIKPKSANWGPQKALIPVDQELSKLGNPKMSINMDEIRKYQSKSNACFAMSPPCANKVSIHAKIDDETGAVFIVPEKNIDKTTLDVVIVKKGEAKIPAYKKNNGALLDPDTMQPFRHGEVDASDMEALEVFADADGNPLTADYDLLAVGSERSAGSTGGTVGPGFDATTRQQVPRGAGAKGTISAELDEAVEQLNKAAERGGYTKGKVVHHGPDVFNPGSEGIFTNSEIEDKLSLSVIDPDHGLLTVPSCDVDCMIKWCRETGRCNPEKVCTKTLKTKCIPVDGDRLLKDYFQNARLRGIDIYPHSSWNWSRYNGLSGWNLTSFLDGVPPEGIPGLHKFASSSSWAQKKTGTGYFGFMRRAYMEAVKKSNKRRGD